LGAKPRLVAGAARIRWRQLALGGMGPVEVADQVGGALLSVAQELILPAVDM